MSSIARSESMSASESMPVDANSTCVRMLSVCVENPSPCACSRTVSMADAERENTVKTERDAIWRPKSVEYMCTLSEEEEAVLNKFKTNSITQRAIQSVARPQSVARQQSVARPQSAQQRPRIMAPPIQYDLRTANAQTVYNHINELTKHDVDASNYLESIKPLMFAQTNPLVFGYIPAPPLSNITQKVIGTHGYFFKMTTTLCGIYYIWHDNTDNTFLFWGPNTFKVVKALNSIRWRIIKHMQAEQEQQAEQQDKLVMPIQMLILQPCLAQPNDSRDQVRKHARPTKVALSK